MPEGPSIVILKELVHPFIGKKIIEVSGNTKIDQARLLNKKITDFKSWGKHFLICFKGFTLRVHFLLFGTYRINEQKESPARLHLGFATGEINFYACSLQYIDTPLDEVYDWTADIMNENWNEQSAIRKLKKKPDALVLDVLLDQNIFAGSGNIFKNEVPYRIKVHPLSRIGALPAAKLRALVRETQQYSFDFYKWKKDYVLKKNWLAHTKRTCMRCKIPFTKAYLGKTARRTFFCGNCQVLYE
jgi:endonuclease-8